MTIKQPLDTFILQYQNAACEFTVCHQRAQILQWKPLGQADVLWCADTEFLSLDKPLRGGIPICWPWFANGECGTLKPSHGFAREANWRCVDIEKVTDNLHKLVYELDDSDISLPQFSHAFTIKLEYLIGKTLSLSLEVDCDVPTFGAFHSYFNVGDIEQTELVGLGSQSIDNLAINFAKKVKRAEPSVITISGPTEKQFVQQSPFIQPVRINDMLHQREIIIDQTNHHDVMLWSPWQATGHTLSDTLPNDYKHFVCVETAAISAPIKRYLTLEISLA